MVRAVTAALTVLFLLVAGAIPAVAGDEARALPDGFGGKWSGTVVEYDTNETYPVELTLDGGGAVGETVGEIAYPAFGCAGDLVLLATVDDVAALREEIAATEGCGGEAELVLRRGDADTLEWTWFWADGEAGAEATLTRHGTTGPPPVRGGLTGAAGSDGEQVALLAAAAAATGDIGPALDRIRKPGGPLGRRFVESWSANRPRRGGDALADALAVRATLDAAWEGAGGYENAAGDLVDALLGAEPRWVGYEDLGERAPETRDALDPAIASAAGLRPGDELADGAIRANALLAAIPPDVLADALPPTGATVAWSGDAWTVLHGTGAIARLDAATIPRVAVETLPPEALDTLDLIARDGPFPHDQDGAVFGNREGILPDAPRGHYREYTVETPDESDRGARRIVTGADGAVYYTDSHYDSFVLVLTEDER